MGYINQPPDLRTMWQDFERRLRKLETAQRFTAPDVATEPTYPRTGDIIYLNSDGYLEYWNGADWVIIADNNVASPKIAYTPTWTGTGLAFTGTPATGHYIKIGKMVFYEIQVNCATVTNFGSGQYSITLPAGLTPSGDYQHLGGLHKASSHYTLLADVNSGSTTVVLYHPTANGTQDIFSYNKPTTLTTGSNWYISGSYFVA